jgi:hypothetical protein
MLERKKARRAENGLEFYFLKEEIEESGDIMPQGKFQR